MNPHARALELAAEGRARLQAKGLLERGVLTVRIPGAQAMAAAGPDLEPRILTFGEETGNPALALHEAVYRRRPDAGAAIFAHPPWGSALADRGGAMPPVFDEQVRHLGPSVLPLHGPGNLDAVRNAHCHAGGCLCLGTTPARAVFNAELLEKCCQAYLLADLAGGGILPIPWLVRLVAGSRLRKDQRKAAAALAQGRFPETATAY